jgi:soluble cytochrome b562
LHRYQEFYQMRIFQLSSLALMLLTLTQSVYATTDMVPPASEPTDPLTSSSTPASHDHHQHMPAGEHLEHLMKQMKNAYRDAMRSQNMAELTVAAATLKDLAQQASATPYGKTDEEITTFKNGMRQLNSDLDALHQAIQANDFAKAQQLLNTQIKATRNQSHQDLDVH